MTFQDIFKKSFVEQFEMGNLDWSTILIALLFSVVLALYLFVIYRFFVKKSMYNLNMNLAIVGMSIITTAIILTIQTNLILSLGMVGALSIVRYRTAVKDPMDLFFLFWSLSNGIMCGANQYFLGIIVTVILTVVVFALAQFPSTKAPYVLVINAKNDEVENEITDVLKTNCSFYRVKSRNITQKSARIIIELRTKEPKIISDEIKKNENISSFSLLTYEGDVVL